MPYRSAHVDREKRKAEPGIVADMVRQFADRHAFLRELVQNGIDAGASRIDVVIDRDDRGVVRTSVTDDGKGMSRAVIEGPLLTLFSSSKEGDSAKIGKYGIGFVSVFALEPDVVEVRTSTGTEAWLLKLFGDHSWELAEDKGGAPRGTVVSLVQPMTAEAFTAHVTAATIALEKWCRHARVPIEVVVLDAGDSSGTTTTSILAPFEPACLVSVTWQEREERIVAAAAPTDGQRDGMLGYYNRGLTLFETHDLPSALEGVRVKIDSPKLSHTLSRDGVVRDREHTRLIARATDLVTERLWHALSQRLLAVAHEATSLGEYFGLLRATRAAAFQGVCSDDQVSVSLVDPIGVQRTMSLMQVITRSDGLVLFAAEPNAMTRALAIDGRPVVRWLECMPFFQSLEGSWEVAAVETAIAYVAPAPERHDGDDALEAELLRLFALADRPVGTVQLSQFSGAGANVAYRVTTDRASAIPADRAAKGRWGRSAFVHLNVEDAGVRLARRRALTEPMVAAHLLLRALLVSEGPLSPKIVDRLLEAALE